MRWSEPWKIAEPPGGSVVPGANRNVTAMLVLRGPSSRVRKIRFIDMLIAPTLV